MKAGSACTSEAPFVGCFDVRGKKYVYDVNTNEILKVSRMVFKEIVEAVTNDSSLTHEDPQTRMLVEQGFLSTHRPSQVCGPCEECLEAELSSKVMQCTLEITQRCNHRCLYCPYSPAETGRRYHSSGSMEWGTIKAAIDYLFDHSSDVEIPSLGFYGGEPLLEWELLLRGIQYAQELFEERKLHLTMTTNGTLISSSIAEALARYGVSVLISLDGPEAIHDRFRKLRRGEAGAFGMTLAGIKKLRSAFGESAIDKVRINAVAGPWSNYADLERFFSINPPPEIEGLDYRISHVGHSDTDSLWQPDEQVDQEEGGKESQSRHALWLCALIAGKVDMKSERFHRRLFEADMVTLHKRQKSFLSDTLGPMGMCMPGVRKSYVNIEGDILLCERVHEKNVIGSVLRDGVDVNRCREVLDQIEAEFQGKCTNCIFCRLCTGCPASYSNSGGEITKQSIQQHCQSQKQHWKTQLMSYVRVLERNPQSLDYMEEINIS